MIGPSDRLQVERLLVPRSGQVNSRAQSLRAAGLPFVEFESFYHAPGWTVRATWQEDVLNFLEGPEWAIEWQGEEVRGDRPYPGAGLARPPESARRDSRSRSHDQATDRSRARDRWGQRRRAAAQVFTDPNHIVKDSWRRHQMMRARVHRVIAEDCHPGLVIVRLRGQRQVDAWLRGPFAGSIESAQPS